MAIDPRVVIEEYCGHFFSMPWDFDVIFTRPWLANHDNRFGDGGYAR